MPLMLNMLGHVNTIAYRINDEPKDDEPQM